MSKKLQTLLIVGAGWEQIPIIEKAMSRGIKVIAVDGNPAAPGLNIASESRVVSTRNSADVLAVAEQYSIDGVSYMISESQLYAVQHVAKSLGLNSPSDKSTDASVSKSDMREIFQAACINNPKYKYVKTLADAEKACQDIGYPLVVKPADSSGQLGLHLIQSSEQLSLAFKAAVNFTNNGEVIIEEWLNGPELNAVGIVLNGSIQSLIISDREKHPTLAFGVVQRHIYPANLTSDQLEATEKLCADVVEALEIKDGIIFPQIIFTKSGPVMVEFGERIPGGIMKELFEYATGYDLINLQIDIALEQIKNLDEYKTIDKHASVVVKFVNCQPGPLKPGCVSKMTGKETILKMDGILAANYFFNADQAQEIKPLKRSSDRFYYIVSAGDSREESCNKAEFAAETIDFLDSDGNSMTNKEYYQRNNNAC